MGDEIASRRPFIVYSIVDREGAERSQWVKIGRAFRNRDGSINVHLDALPTNGKLHMREADDSGGDSNG